MPKVMKHKILSTKMKISIILKTYFPIFFIIRGNKKAKKAFEKDTME